MLSPFVHPWNALFAFFRKIPNFFSELWLPQLFSIKPNGAPVLSMQIHFPSLPQQQMLSARKTPWMSRKYTKKHREEICWKNILEGKSCLKLFHICLWGAPRGCLPRERDNAGVTLAQGRIFKILFWSQVDILHNISKVMQLLNKTYLNVFGHNLESNIWHLHNRLKERERKLVYTFKHTKYGGDCWSVFPPKCPNSIIEYLNPWKLRSLKNFITFSRPISIPLKFVERQESM